jgi:hypothetical protein
LLAGDAAVHIRASANMLKSKDAKIWSFVKPLYSQMLIEHLGVDLLKYSALSRLGRPHGDILMSLGATDRSRVTQLLQSIKAPLKSPDLVVLSKICLPISSEHKARRALKSLFARSESILLSLPPRAAEKQTWKKLVRKNPDVARDGLIRRIKADYLIAHKNGHKFATLLLRKTHMELRIPVGGGLASVAQSYRPPSPALLANLERTGFWKSNAALFVERRAQMRMGIATSLIKTTAGLTAVNPKDVEMLWQAGRKEVLTYNKFDRTTPIAFDFFFLSDRKGGWGLTRDGERIFGKLIAKSGASMKALGKALPRYFPKRGLFAGGKQQLIRDVQYMGWGAYPLLAFFFWPNQLAWISTVEPRTYKEQLRGRGDAAPLGKVFTLDRKQKLLLAKY